MLKSFLRFVKSLEMKREKMDEGMLAGSPALSKYVYSCFSFLSLFHRSNDTGRITRDPFLRLRCVAFLSRGLVFLLLGLSRRLPGSSSGSVAMIEVRSVIFTFVSRHLLGPAEAADQLCRARRPSLGLSGKAEVGDVERSIRYGSLNVSMCRTGVYVDTPAVYARPGERGVPRCPQTSCLSTGLAEVRPQMYRPRQYNRPPG